MREIARVLCIFVLRKSIAIHFDCLRAARRLFSIVFLLLPMGLLISHFIPFASMSGVVAYFGRRNTTSVLKCCASNSAADNS